MKKNAKIPFQLRRLISSSQPSNPLHKRAPCTIDIIIPCHTKDSKNLGLVIQGVLENVENPIGRVKIISPRSAVANLKERFPECFVIADEDVLPGDVLAVINDSVPENRRGWICQQVIKFIATMKSSEVACLVLDADTILLEPKLWIDSTGVQILSFAHEFHGHYKHHISRSFGTSTLPLSFVTHHQLMQREFLKEIFGEDGAGLISWIRNIDYSDNSACSEYETYGEWVLANHPEKVKFAKWNNISETVNLDSMNSYQDIHNYYSGYSSISNHSHLNTLT
jgi:hypothetical protein